jgi:hypothetical protein
MDRLVLELIGAFSVAKEIGMPSKNVLDEVLSSRFLATDRDAVATRRALLLAPLITSLPLAPQGRRG